MNEVLKALKERRSCRKFTDKMPDEDLINQVVEAGLYAPSGHNAQDVKIIAVTNKNVRDKISEANRKIGGWKEGFDPFYGAPVILVVIADKNEANRVYDGSLVMGNLMNAAHSLGLGNIWIHRAKQEFESDEGKNFLKSLGIEGEWEGIGHCALGFAAEENPMPPERKADRVYYVR